MLSVSLFWRLFAAGLTLAVRSMPPRLPVPVIEQIHFICPPVPISLPLRTFITFIFNLFTDVDCSRFYIFCCSFVVFPSPIIPTVPPPASDASISYYWSYSPTSLFGWEAEHLHSNVMQFLCLRNAKYFTIFDGYKKMKRNKRDSKENGMKWWKSKLEICIHIVVI